MPRRDSGPELALRSELHRRGLRFRIQMKELPGTPDIALTRAKIAIFVDGCFWHSCPEHAVLPKANRAWWAEKLQKNVLRDRTKDRQLADMGWEPIHVWEHEDPEAAATYISERWRQCTSSNSTC